MPVALLLRVLKLPVLRLPAPSRLLPPRQRQAVQCNSKTKPLLRRRAQIEEDGDQGGYFRYHRGMMGGGMMAPGMMGRGYGRGTGGPMVMMRIIFSLMDANGDGKLSLEEFQAAHERIFKAMDADHDGTVTLEEMQAFMRGH